MPQPPPLVTPLEQRPDPGRLQQADHDDDRRLEHRGRLCRNAQEQHGLVQRRDQKSADDRPADGELATRQRGSADDHGEDGVHLHRVAGLRDVDRVDGRGRHDAGDGGQQPGQRIDGDEQPTRLDARHPAGPRVDADRFDHHAESGAPDDDRDHGENRQCDQEDHREPEHIAVGDPVIAAAGLDGRVLATRDDLRQAAAGHHHHQRAHERLEADNGDEDGVDQADRQPHDQAERDRGRHRGERGRIRREVEVLQGDRARNGHHRAHREVDASRGDDEDHSEGDHQDRGGQLEDVDDVADQPTHFRAVGDRQVAGVLGQVEHQQEHDHQHAPEELGAGQPRGEHLDAIE
jgi:hypothetical protein